MNAPIITLTTDFGLKDSYVASMKGAILSICPEALLVDVSHLVPPQDIRAGAFVLSGAYDYFPKGAIHLAVVDPGVGTERKGLVIKTPDHYFVGPDNGLFAGVTGRERHWEARSLENPAYWRSVVSKTFHGRDVFAPVAAHLARGAPVEVFGPSCTPVSPSWKAAAAGEGVLKGEVIYVDHFGNAVTNITRDVLEAFAPKGAYTVRAGSKVISALADTYGRVKPGECIALVGSSGYLEIAVNQGSAARKLKIQPGDRVAVSLTPGSK